MLLVLAAPGISSPRRGGAAGEPASDRSPASVDIGDAVVVGRDGAIVVAGLSRRGGRYQFGLARYRPNGTLDPRFGTGGRVLTSFPRGGSGDAALAEQPDGKLVVAGAVRAATNQTVFGIGRYTRRGGRLDPSFGRGGTVMTPAPAPRRGTFSLTYAGGLVLQRDGKLVVAGARTNIKDRLGIALARYTSAGTLDPTFGVRGKVETDLGSRSGAAESGVALQADGKIVTAGYSSMPHLAAARFTSRGALDGGFGSAGTVVTPVGAWSEAGGVAIQPDRRILVAASAFVPHSGVQLAVVRYLPNGRVDTSFGVDGTVVTNFAVNGRPAIAIQRDGKIVVACGVGNPRRFGLARYDTRGALDPTFGEGGKVRARFAKASTAHAVALQGDGKIVVTGSSGGDFALARYSVDGELDESFGTGGLVTTALGPAWVARR
ncbi:MAG TPA: hypothetical protein VF101_12250 [Gaiellaceae bacterium]